MKKIHLLFVLAFFICKNSNAQLIINEVLYDPGDTLSTADANGDGIRSSSHDEFIEFFNNSLVPMNLSGYKLFDGLGLRNNVPRHIIPNGTIIQPKKAFVVFGGGTPTGSFGGAIIQTATTSDLNLTNAGDTITVRDSANNFILSLDIEPWSNNPNEAYTRSPDITGVFVQHRSILGNTKTFSPGTDINGMAFNIPINRMVTFKIDMNQYNSNFTKVSIAGNFNNWCNSCNQMLDSDNDGLWEVTLQLTTDTLVYKFVLDTILQENFSNTSSCTALIGGSIRRYSILKSDSIFKSACFETCIQCANGLSLKGITDFRTSAGASSGKTIHLVADSNISNLSIYGIGIANNGGGSNGQEYRFPPIFVSKGSNILLVRDTAVIASYFNDCWPLFNVILLDTTGTVSQNGNDAVELFKVKEVVETFGDVNVNGTGKPWEYTGSWAFKNSLGNWTYGALNCTDSTSTIFKSKCVYPICADLKVKTIVISGENNINSITQNGGTLKIIASILPLNAKDTTVTWSVTNPGVATINSNGILTAITNGNSVVTATANDGSGIFATRSINITGQIIPAILVSSVSISSQNNLRNITQPNGTLNFFTNILPKNATDTTVNWDVDNKNIATINTTGTLTALDNGTVKVKATSNDGSLKSDSITIIISGQFFKVSSIIIGTEGNAVSITKANGTLAMIANILPKNATDTNVTWSVNNPSIATISSNGVLTAKNNGMVRVIANANDGSNVSDTINITISGQNIKVSSLKIFTSGNILDITEPNETLNFFTNILPRNASDTSVTWSVDKTNLATINNKGLLTAKANGIVRVKALSNDGSGKSDSVNVIISNQVNTKEINKIKIKVFPNPTQNIINIESEIEIKEFKISNLLGVVVDSGKIESNQKDIQALANGVYFLELKINDIWAKFKIIKN
ncbi:MAG: Ig-like domain-containing protein [Candidatus Methylacidiphilales bacterium]